jgi:hypothetical protein
MGNIIGEGFKDYVIDQIDQRQKNLAREDRNTELLQEQNSKSAWIKLTSSILISDRGKFGPQAENEEDIAKKYTLFGGTSINLKPLGGLGAYDKFGFEQGYRPMPGILSLETKNRNRGSVRETTIQMRAYSREQFYYIDLLYLRLGYSVLVEFGNSLYYDNKGIPQKFTDADTVTADFLGNGGSKYKGNHHALLKALEEKRKSTSGNYDAIFGQIRNFDWSFNPEGYYDITLSVISYGDVLESLKANVPAKDEPVPLTEEDKKDLQNIQSVLDKATKDSQVIDILRNLDVIGNLAWKIKQNLLLYSQSIPVPNTEISVRLLSDQSVFEKTEGYADTDAVGIIGSEYGNTKENYYIRFGAFLQFLWEQGMLYVDKDGVNALVTVDNDVATNLMYRTPYTFSTNPGICIVKTNITVQQDGRASTYRLFKEIPEGGSFIPNLADQQTYPDAGFLMNIYVNLGYILRQGFQIRDSQNIINFYDLISKICDGINQSLGGVNKLEPVVDEQESRMYILDQHPIPSIQKEERRLAEFSIYGLTPGKKGSFVTDFGIRTSITNALASTVTIGAQANGAVKGAEATAFATWNAGLIDRILPIKQNQDSNIQTQEDLIQLERKNNNLRQEYLNFLAEMFKYKWDPTKAEEMGTIMGNILSFTEAASGLAGQGTKGGFVGFIPINLNMTFDGLSGMKIYQRFKVTQNFLPYNYPNTLQFIITGITHQISNNKWTTTIDTNVVPETITSNTDQNFTGVQLPANTAGSGTGTATTQNNGALGFPNTTSAGIRLRLYRKKDDGIQTTGQLLLLDAAGKTLRTYTTVERPWKGNESKISCIPPGTYTFTKSKSNKSPGLGDVLRLSNPRHRAGVLVHVGNKPTDSEGCILPQIPSKGSRAAMKEILDLLYPVGQPNQTYTIEVYGVDGKQYVDVRDDRIYNNPGGQTQNIVNEEISVKNYTFYVQSLNSIFKLQDDFGTGRQPLLKDLKSILGDDEKTAVIRIQQLFNIYPSVIRTPWQNKLPLSKLTKEHKKLFESEVRRMNQTKGRFLFIIPTALYGKPGQDSKWYGTPIELNTDF